MIGIRGAVGKYLGWVWLVPCDRFDWVPSCSHPSTELVWGECKLLWFSELDRSPTTSSILGFLRHSWGADLLASTPSWEPKPTVQLLSSPWSAGVTLSDFSILERYEFSGYNLTLLLALNNCEAGTSRDFAQLEDAVGQNTMRSLRVS